MPKITGSSLEEHRQQTKTRIFAAMEQLLAEQGYDSITLAEIAAAAGVGRTVMYNYFPDKEALLLDLAGEQTEDYLRRLDAALRRASSPIEELRVFVRMQLRELTQQHAALGSLRVVLSETGQRRMMEHVAPISATLRRIVERAQEEGYLPPDDLDVVLPLVSAAISGRSTVLLKGRALDRAIEATSTFVLRGLGARLDEAGEPVPLESRRATG